MKFAAVSDLHLGFRAFSATEGARNVREMDVERAWERAQGSIVSSGAELVLVPGDIFDSPRPSFHAVKAWRDGVRRLLGAGCQVVAIPGNHDAGRTAAALSPVLIPDDLAGFHVVIEAQRIHLNVGSERVAVACLPFNARTEGQTYRLEPDLDADLNVLLIHAPVQSSPDADRVPFFYAGEESIDVGRAAERFDLVVAGDFHEQRWLHPSRRAFYPGSIERTSSNIWQEYGRKGVVVGDTAVSEFEFVTHETREFDSLGLGDFFDDVPPMPEITAELVNDCLRRKLEEAINGWMIRLIVHGFPREQRGDLAWDIVKQLKSKCTHFQLDLRFAGADRRRTPPSQDAGGGRPRTLIEEAREFLEDEPEDVRTLALSYLGDEDAGGACLEDPDGLHHVGCGCEDSDWDAEPQNAPEQTEIAV